jgi:hypothetical protein
MRLPTGNSTFELAALAGQIPIAVMMIRIAVASGRSSSPICMYAACMDPANPMDDLSFELNIYLNSQTLF